MKRRFVAEEDTYLFHSDSTCIAPFSSCAGSSLANIGEELVRDARSRTHSNARAGWHLL